MLCLHGEWDGWVTVWREWLHNLATVRCTIAAFRTPNLCVWVERGCGKKKGQKAEKIHQRLKGMSLNRESQAGLWTEIF